nr:ATP-dependent DNA helicase [Micromonospora sp. NBRC 107566]
MRQAPAPGVPALREDPLQRRVVGHTAGPLLVVGGPGTGKTTTLVEAVAARVAEGADPERVLVLTFGRRGAQALRGRIEARIAGAGAPLGAPPTASVVHEPLVRTFHGYAFGLLRRAAAQRGEPAPRLLTAPEQDLVIRELLASAEEGGWPASLRSALHTRAFAEQLRDLLLRANERGISAAQLAELGELVGREDWPAAARFLHEYQAVLALRTGTGREPVAYDYAELVRAAVGLLAGDPELLAAERRRLEFVYADELHDTDPAQLDLLELVAGGGRHLVAFADPDSSTFAFRGADPGGVHAFPDRFTTVAGAPAPAVTLTRSYRSGADLVAATRRVASRLRGPARHRALLPAPEAGPGEVEVRRFASATAESAYLAYALREAHLMGGVPWSRMAVLLRSTHLQLAPIRRALHAAGVPTSTLAEDLPLHLQPAVVPLLLLLRCAIQPDLLDEPAAVVLLHSPLGGADPLAERRLRHGLRARALAGGDRRPSGDLLVAALRDPAGLADLERRWAAPARAVARLLATAREVAGPPESTVEDVLWAVWRASGLADRWVEAALGTPATEATGVTDAAARWRASAADRDLDAVVALFDAAARFADRLPGARLELFLEHVLGQDLPADSLAPTADRGDAVRLLTAHAAKGQEWDVVAVAGVQEGIWPDLRLRGSLLGSERLVDVAAGRATGPGAAAAGMTSALLDEERRLFYVAATRARRRLLVTAVESASVGGADGAEQPSRFLHELGGTRPSGRGDGPPSPRPPEGPTQGPQAGAGAPEPGPEREPDDAGEPPLTRPPRALTLPALVAELRTAAADEAAPEARRRAAAAQLARLAGAGVPGAHPDEWWGLLPLSDDRPLVPAGAEVRVTPSTIESALRCGLRWLLERHGGGAPPSPAQNIGMLVHAAATRAADAAADREAMLEYVAQRFPAIELAARWLAGPEQARAEQMVDKLLHWLSSNPRRLLAIEREFEVRLAGDGDRPVVLSGKVDRLERDADGRLVVVDLKTGRSTGTRAELAEHPQLAGYQVAVEAGAFAEHGTVSGGAALVQLGTTTRQAREQEQPPLAGAPDPAWARELVQRTAATMAAGTFQAVANSRCRICPVRTACPLSGHGRQVVQP